MTSQLTFTRVALTALVAASLGGVGILLAQVLLHGHVRSLVAEVIAPTVVMAGVHLLVMNRLGINAANAKQRIVAVALACFAVVIASTVVVGILAPLVIDPDFGGRGGTIMRALFSGVVALAVLIQGFVKNPARPSAQLR